MPGRDRSPQGRGGEESGGCEFSKGAFGAVCTTEKIRQEFTTAGSPQYNDVAKHQIAIIEVAGLAAKIQAAAKYPNEVFPRGESLWVEQAHWACHALNCTATSPNPGFKSPHDMWFGSPPSSSPFPFLKPGFRIVKRSNKLQPKAVRCWYLGPAPNYPRDAMRILGRFGRVVATRYVTWAHIPTHIPSTPQRAIFAPRENSSDGDESGEGQAPSPAVKSRTASSEDDGSGGEGHFGGDMTDDGIDDGLDNLDGTPQKMDERRKRCRRKLRTFNAKRTNRQGSVVEITSGRFSNAPSRGGRATRLCTPEPEGLVEAAVIPRTTPRGAVTSTHQHHHLRKTAERVPAAVGKTSQRLRPTRHPTPNPRQIAGRELPGRYFPGGTDATWSEWKDCPS